MAKHFAAISQLCLRVFKMFRNVELGIIVLTILTEKNCLNQFSARIN